MRQLGQPHPEEVENVCAIWRRHYLDMVGVTGSIPVAPTMIPRGKSIFFELFGTMSRGSPRLNKP
jgi:hypothetical protein